MNHLPIPPMPIVTFRTAARPARAGPPTSFRRRERPTAVVTVIVEGVDVRTPDGRDAAAVVAEAVSHLLPAGYAVDVPAVVPPPRPGEARRSAAGAADGGGRANGRIGRADAADANDGAGVGTVVMAGAGATG